MCAIMDELHRYVPQVAVSRSAMTSDGVVQYRDCEVSPVLFGGDQLTVARARGAKALRSNEDTSVKRLEGFIPVVEDRHARQTLLKVIADRCI